MLLYHIQCPECLSEDLTMNHVEVDHGRSLETGHHDIEEYCAFTCCGCGTTGNVEGDALLTLQEVDDAV